MLILLDSNILSLLVTPINQNQTEDEQRNRETAQCQDWFYRLYAKAVSFRTSEICDYELRRELLRIKSPSLDALNQLRELIDFETLTPEVLQTAAQIWAEARGVGQPNVIPENIDIDCILAAHWFHLKQQQPGRQVIIATQNIQDFQRVTDCAPWQAISYP